MLADILAEFWIFFLISCLGTCAAQFTLCISGQLTWQSFSNPDIVIQQILQHSKDMADKYVKSKEDSACILLLVQPSDCHHLQVSLLFPWITLSMKQVQKQKVAKVFISESH